MSNNHTLIVIIGPTGVGKTRASLSVASHFNCDIISADSRQMYKNMTIGTAAPTQEELSVARHHFIQFLHPNNLYNASQYETDVMQLLPQLFKQNSKQVLVGGSMMYVDAICKGIDLMPDVDPEVRKNLKKQLATDGLEALRIQLKTLDPATYNKVDLKNPARVLHAVEVCITTGKPYSSFLTQSAKKRDFNIIKVGIDAPRPKLYDRINQRVDNMIKAGLVNEVKALLPYKDYNALNTVGYKEIFEYLDGKISLKRATDLIKRNSRRYAKKQLTWFRRDSSVTWFQYNELEQLDSWLNNRFN